MLPNPNVIIPVETATLQAMLDDQRLEWLGALSSQGRGGFDGQREARIAMANLNHLLDHYPSGSPRDYIVQYSNAEAISSPLVPETVELGTE